MKQNILKIILEIDVSLKVKPQTFIRLMPKMLKMLTEKAKKNIYLIEYYFFV